MSLYTIEDGYHKGSNKPRRAAIMLFTAVFAFGGYLIYHPAEPANEISRPAAAISVPPPAPKITTPMPWPEYGQSAYGVLDKGVLAASDENAPSVPIASLAKVITALAILKEKPLKPGEQGPTLTLSEEDVALYNSYVRKNGSVLPVEPGEQISQYQAMQAMLMSSANNISDSLAIWAFGSLDKYNEYANKMVTDYGLTRTKVADASGYSPGTISTAPEMIKLAELYLQDPVLLEIATQTEATIPIADKIQNYNAMVNKDGIVGIKVGDTDEAGRCFIVADIRKTDGKIEAVAIAVIVGAPHLTTAMEDAQTILRAGNSGYDNISH